MTLTAEQEDVKLTDDLAPYERFRFHQARAVGFTRLEAARFAYGTGTLHTLWQLKADGCDPATMARILC